MRGTTCYNRHSNMRIRLGSSSSSLFLCERIDPKSSILLVIYLFKDRIGFNPTVVSDEVGYFIPKIKKYSNLDSETRLCIIHYNGMPTATVNSFIGVHLESLQHAAAVLCPRDSWKRGCHHLASQPRHPS